MRGYFVGVFRNIAKAVPQPETIRMYIAKHRAATFMMAALVVVITTSGLFVAKRFVASAMQADNDSDGVSSLSVDESKSSTPSSDSSVHVSQQVTNTVSSSGDTSTQLRVNNQQIAVPKNGSVHKTIHSDGGTTHIDISASGGSTNSNISTFSSNVQTTDDSYDQYVGP